MSGAHPVHPIDQNASLIADFERVYGPHASHEHLFPFDPTAAHRDAKSPRQEEARATTPTQVVLPAGGTEPGPSTRTTDGSSDAAHVTRHAPQWIAGIQRFLEALQQGQPEEKVDAVRDMHVVMKAIELWKAGYRCGTLKVFRIVASEVLKTERDGDALQDAVTALAAVQHPTLPLAGIRSRAQRVVDFWSKTQAT